MSAAASPWELGSYERIAEQLHPAAERLVLTAPAPGERVLDLGCGTGSAAIVAADRGASVVGVDPAPRLLYLAAASARERDLEATFQVGTAEAIPLPHSSVDLTISAFGLIFAADSAAVAAELGRVSTTGARVLYSAWLPTGALFELAGIRRAAVGAGPPGPPPFAWHDGQAAAALLAPYGFAVSVAEEALAFTAPSPAAFLESELRDHPMWAAAQGTIPDEVRAGALEILERANEDPQAFRVTSRYAIVRAARA